MSEVIVEVIGSPTNTVEDIDAAAAFFGDRTTPVKDAVQHGRRITTLRHHEFGMSVRSAFMSAHVREH